MQLVITPLAARPEPDDRLLRRGAAPAARRGAPLDVGLQDAKHDAEDDEEDDEADQDPRQGVHLETHGWTIWIDGGSGRSCGSKREERWEDSRSGGRKARRAMARRAGPAARRARVL